MNRLLLLCMFPVLLIGCGPKFYRDLVTAPLATIEKNGSLPYVNHSVHVEVIDRGTKLPVPGAVVQVEHCFRKDLGQLTNLFEDSNGVTDKKGQVRLFCDVSRTSAQVNVTKDGYRKFSCCPIKLSQRGRQDARLTPNFRISPYHRVVVEILRNPSYRIIVPSGYVGPFIIKEAKQTIPTTKHEFTYRLTDSGMIRLKEEPFPDEGGARFFQAIETNGRSLSTRDLRNADSHSKACEVRQLWFLGRIDVDNDEDRYEIGLLYYIGSYKDAASARKALVDDEWDDLRPDAFRRLHQKRKQKVDKVGS